MKNMATFHDATWTQNLDKGDMNLCLQLTKNSDRPNKQLDSTAIFFLIICDLLDTIKQRLQIVYTVFY